MKTIKNTPADPGLIYVMRMFWLIVAERLAESGMTLDEAALMIGGRGERLRAYIADPLETPAAYLIVFATMFDTRPSELWEQANERGRLIEHQVADGVACHRCGRAFPVGSTSRPDGFGEHGQLFRCGRGFGCGVHPARRGPEFVDLVCDRCGGHAGRVRGPAGDVPVVCAGCSSRAGR